MKNKIFIGILCCITSIFSCKEAEPTEQSDSTEQRNQPNALQFCWNILDKCRGADEIVDTANYIAALPYYFDADPCSTDGQRDAFRHIYSMVWITRTYGMTFAQSIGDHKDPENPNETNPQKICEREMDRHNNYIGIITRSLPPSA